MKKREFNRKNKRYPKKEIARLQSRVLELWKADKSHAFELGEALLEVRRAMRERRGAFKAWWKSKGLVQSRVSYCMDLAKGKLRDRQEKPQPPERVKASEATQFVKKKLSELFRTCTGVTDKLALATIGTQLRDAVGATFAQAALLVGWKLDTPEAKKAGDDLSNAIAAFVSVLSRHTTDTSQASEQLKKGAASTGD